jgi:hypothetical protein
VMLTLATARMYACVRVNVLVRVYGIVNVYLRAHPLVPFLPSRTHRSPRCSVPWLDRRGVQGITFEDVWRMKSRLVAGEEGTL